jgi:tetratricopeptide (TPR) repeat protein
MKTRLVRTTVVSLLAAITLLASLSATSARAFTAGLSARVASRSPWQTTTVTSTFELPLTVSPTITSTLSISDIVTTGEDVSKVVTGLENTLFPPLLFVLKLVAIVLGFVVAWRVLKLMQRSPELVIGDFTNATGDDSLDKRLTGLGQSAREKLIGELGGVLQRIKKHSREVAPDLDLKQLTDQFPLPQGAADQRLTDLMNSIKEAAPEPVKFLPQLLNMAFPARGTKVTSVLQRDGDAPGCLSITFEITDLRQERAPKLFTIYERSCRQPVSRMAAPAAGSAVAPANQPVPQAQAFYEVGVLLDQTGRFKEASGYFEQSLKQGESSGLAAKALSATAAKLQVQAGHAATYAIGHQLRDAGLIEAAIDSLIKPLPTTVQRAAAADWGIICGQTSGDKAIAYWNLARLYKQDDVLLFDEALELYKQAAAAGSQTAASDLDQLQHAAADNLTEVGRRLLGIAELTEAEKYLLAALEHVPDHVGARETLATVKQAQPIADEDKEAVALYRLGALYEARGALEAAKGNYEEALKKQTDHAEAAAALDRVLSAPRGAAERYLQLFKFAYRQLAIELACREMQAEVDRRQAPHRERNLGQVYNFIGALYQATGLGFQDPSFYELAIQSFKAAIEANDDWYQPFENLADTYGMLAQISEPGKARSWYSKALIQYDELLERFPDLQPDVKHRVRTSDAAVRLQLGGDTYRAQAVNAIEQLEQKWDTTRWNANPKETARSLYNLADWFARAHRAGLPKCLGKARCYLAYSLARSDNKDFDGWVGTDAVFTAIIEADTHGRAKLDQLKAIIEHDKRNGGLQQTGPEFAQAIDTILDQLGWRVEP